MLGFLFARWGVALIIALSPGSIPRLNEVSIDGRVLLFTFAAHRLRRRVLGSVDG